MENENTRDSKVKQMFEQHPAMDEVYVTSDDYGFTELHRADAHAGNLKAKKVDHYTRSVFMSKEETPVSAPVGSEISQMSVKNLTEAIKEVATVEALEVLKAEELAKGEEARKTAVKAIEDRIAELSFDPENPANTVKDIEVVDEENVEGADKTATEETK